MAPRVSAKLHDQGLGVNFEGFKRRTFWPLFLRGKAGTGRVPTSGKTGNCFQMSFRWAPSSFPRHRNYRKWRGFLFHGCWPALIDKTKLKTKLAADGTTWYIYKGSVNQVRFNSKIPSENAEATKVWKGTSTVYPAYSLDKKDTKPLRKRMKRRWANISVGVNHTNKSFWCREWKRHGIFSGLPCKTYFRRAYNLAERMLKGKNGLNAIIRSLGLHNGEMVEQSRLVEAVCENFKCRPKVRIMDDQSKTKKVLKDLIILFDTDLKTMISYPIFPSLPFLFETD